ncbi:ATP-binding protein [Pseudoalteromonas sp.]|uniref:HD domain-containing protein n=1 Tax=Pseudoalteromonas sp. TaxID=53249 RepID=UPI0023545284|nr:ATP-binding protein [Pseudoalteromonas sp.]
MDSNSSTSKLIKRIINQKGDNFNGGENFQSIFDQFSAKVGAELTETNKLFDEFTPHDETHMVSLFRITDELLSNAIDNLNGCEACILACAIYGHDWGMAVSDAEKERIVTGRTPSNSETSDFALLDDEQNMWLAYCQNNKIECDENGFVENHYDVSTVLWRGYVRNTHSSRALIRCRHYFKGDLASIGIALGEVCAGHWYAIEDIAQLSSSQSICSYTVNLRVLATYIRFIDLLDIGANRTPYALWKFINPKNEVSKIEWLKHLALNPITIRNSSESDPRRFIQVHGETKDIDVYTALLDMQRYITVQIKENTELLLKEGDKNLGCIEVEWKIVADGFEPTDIRFEFERNGMFEILKGEIYDGDPYVFLRELLQNSVDAIQLRKHRLNSSESDITFQPKLEVFVKHEINGDSVIRVTDNGIGMNTNIVKNYLAVLGKSYYRSKEFLDLELDIPPISKFGVGLLSCFEVADSISIETKTDPYLDNLSKGLRVDIADFSKQFRIEYPKKPTKTGTTISVYVKGEKWKKDDFSQCSTLEVTNYLKKLAGFISFPISVSEHDKKTIILSAITTPFEFQKIVSENPSCDVYIQGNDNWSDTIIDFMDRESANEIFEEKSECFSFDYDGMKLEGKLRYFLPKENILFWSRNTSVGTGIGRSGGTFRIKKEKSVTNVEVHWLDVGNHKIKNLSPSVKHKVHCQVYLKGILMPECEISIAQIDMVPHSHLSVNIIASGSKYTPNLSRTKIKQPIQSLADNITNVCYSNFVLLFNEKLAKRTLSEKFFEQIRYSRIISPKNILKNLSVMRLNYGGDLSFSLFEELPQRIEIAPVNYLKRNKGRAGWPPEQGCWPPKAWLNTKLPNADEIVDQDKIMIIEDTGMSIDDGSSMEWSQMYQFSRESIDSKYKTVSYRIAVAQGQSYIIKQKEIGEKEVVNHQNNKLNYTSFEFSDFNGQLEKYACLLPIENNSHSSNMMHKMIFNRKHPAIKILEKTTVAINEGMHLLSFEHESKIKRAYVANPLVGYMKGYIPNTFEQAISEWIKVFCLAAADLDLVHLNSKERDVINSNILVVACLD